MPELILKLGDNIIQKYIFLKETINIGRTPENQIVIENLAVSRHHSSITWEDGRYLIADMGSSNGTYVNGVRVKKTEIFDRDVITIGKHKLYFYNPQDAERERRPTLVDNERTMLVQPTLQGTLEIIKGRQQGQRFHLGPARTNIGRGTNNEIRLTDWFVSKTHAVVERRGQDFFLRDLGSWRHTFHNGIAVEEARLKDGDIIQLGPTVQMRFTAEESFQELARPARLPLEMGAEEAGAREEVGAETHESQPVTHAYEGRSIRLEPVEEEIAEPPAGAPEMKLKPIRVQPLFEEVVQAATPAEQAVAPAEGVDSPIELEPAPPADPGAPQPQPPAPEPPAERPEPIIELGRTLEGPVPFEIPMEELVGVTVPAGEMSAADEAEYVPPPEPAGTPEKPGAQPESAIATVRPDKVLSGADSAARLTDRDEEIRLWEAALKNKSAAIRKQAARRLKQLTGQDYEH